MSDHSGGGEAPQASTKWSCKDCHYEDPNSQRTPNFCPDCGAKQSEETETKKTVSQQPSGNQTIDQISSENTSQKLFCKECNEESITPATKTCLKCGSVQNLEKKSKENMQSDNEHAVDHTQEQRDGSQQVVIDNGSDPEGKGQQINPQQKHDCHGNQIEPHPIQDGTNQNDQDSDNKNQTNDKQKSFAYGQGENEGCVGDSDRMGEDENLTPRDDQEPSDKESGGKGDNQDATPTQNKESGGDLPQKMDMDGQTGKNHVSDPEKIPSDKSELQDNQGKSLQNKNGAQLDSNENESGEASFQVGQDESRVLVPKSERKDQSLVEESGAKKKKNNDGASSKPQIRSQTVEHFQTVDIAGIQPTPEKKFSIFFHILIPKNVWGLNNHTCKSCVHLRFGHSSLGMWTRDIGEFELMGVINDELYRYRCQLSMDSDILRDENKLAYKYVVYNSMEEKEENRYEFLYGVPESKTRPINRCLIVPTAEFQSGTYHKYDSVAYPKTETKNVIMRAVNKIRSKDSTKSEVTIPSHEVMQSDALFIYLEDHSNSLYDLSITNIEKVSREITHIFTQLNDCLIWIDGHGSRSWNCEGLAKDMINHLLSIVDDLNEFVIGDAKKNGRRMSSVLTILCSLSSIIPNYAKMEGIHYDYISQLLSMLRLMPDIVKRECVDYDYLMQLIPGHFRKVARDSVYRFIIYLSHEKHFDLPKWLYSIPLAHFLYELSKPFECSNLNLDPKMIQFGDKIFGFKCEMSGKNYKIVETMLEDLKTLMELDPLFIYGFIDICPRQELSKLIHNINPFISISFLAKMLKEKQAIKSIETHEISQMVAAVMIPLRSCNQESQLLPRLDAAMYLLSETLPKINQITGQIRIQLLKAVIVLVLESAKSLEVYKADPEIKDEWSQCIVKRFDELYDWLNKWFNKNAGECFGKMCYKGSFIKSLVEIEIKVWKVIIPVDIGCDKIQNMWENDVVRRIIKHRMEGVQRSERMSLLKAMESVSDIPSIISNAFFAAIMEIINNISSTELQEIYIKSCQKENIGKIVDEVLAQQYSNQDEVLLDELLNWDMWQTFIKIHRNTDSADSQVHLSDKSEILCTCAETALSDVCDKAESGKVTLNEIRKMKKRRNHVKLLIDESYDKDKAEILKQLLEERYAEQAKLIERAHFMGKLCHGVTIHVQGKDQLIEEIQAIMDGNISINTLCRREKPQNTIVFISLKAASSLDDITKKFDILNSSALFNTLWNKHMTRAEIKFAKSHSQLTIQNIKTDIWDPCFQECQKMLSSLCNKTMLLSEVDHYFSSSDDIENTQTQILVLYKSVQQCAPDRTDIKDHDLISDAVKCMEKYWSLCRLNKVAKVVMNLKSTLKLTGDFSLIETLATKVTSSMQSSPLSSIDSKLTKAGKFLEQFEDNPQKVDCLQTFANCINIVEWIRKDTKDVNDLHKFVSVALHTSAGEGDLANDKLSNLKIIGSGFGPLIYDLKIDPSFETFKISCESVWESLKQNRKLPKLLGDCNAEVEWYKSVKETQASVEVTSYGQMNNIFEYGCYRVGTKRSVVCQNYSEVIHLSLKERGKRLTKKSYNLEELRDLESKLVLITGSKAEYRAQVDLFVDILHSICRIAEVLITLQQVGNVKYTGWLLQVPCSTTCNKTIVNVLQQQAKKMETELYEWRDKVKHTRFKFYELNYYTTRQLLVLRKEFGAIKNLERPDASPNSLALLQSISSQLSSDMVCEVVKCTPQCVSEASSNAGIVGYSQESLETNQDLSMSDVSMISVDCQVSGRGSQTPIISEKPTLTEDDLSEDEKVIMMYVIPRIACPKLLVFKAFEECRGKEMDKYDYQKWCLDHLEKYEFSDKGDSEDEASDEVLSSSSSSESESEKAVSNIRIIQVQSAIQEPVDENNSVIKELIGAGYSVEQSIVAVERYETLEGALAYLEDEAMKEIEEDNDLIPSTCLSREDSQPVDDFKISWSWNDPPKIHADGKAEEKYLSLEQLGIVLRELSERSKDKAAPKQRKLVQALKDGYPNLLVVQPDAILRTTLSLYMEDLQLPLPTPEEVLMCNCSTTAEEVELFWMRAVSDPEHWRIFSLVHAEKLSYQVCDLALRTLFEHSQGKQGYRLVIICSNEDEVKSHFISKLHLYRRTHILSTDIQSYREYLIIHYTNKTEASDNRYDSSLSASIVDNDKSCVRIVSSNRSGMGKSLYIQRLAEDLKSHGLKQSGVHVTIPLHGPVVTPDTVLDLFEAHMKNPNPTCSIYHIDIAPNILWEVDTILFSLLVLRGLSDSQGRVWRCHPNQLYAIEVTLPNMDTIPERDKKSLPQNRTLALLKLMPSVSCLSPRKAYDCMQLQVEHKDDSIILMDLEEFRSPSYQRVYQYLRRHTMGSNLDAFAYTGLIEGEPKDCLHMILQKCGVKDPSWSEIRHFVKFLDLQLQSCEKSVFIDPKLVGDVMAGLKGFVVKFMIRMSRDFSTSSLRGEVALEMNEESDGDDLDQYQISERKCWEQNPHPYIFFNHDRSSITFVGFTVRENGDLINPSNQRIIEPAIINSQLYDGLKQNNVDFKDDYHQWKKSILIEKISIVMGVEYPYDPDESYVLTVDNLIKILAIQMRFRCCIPVVIMGETGCGKTRLIRYMCDLARQGMERTNMLILKVHGGTTEKDIENFICIAEKESDENRRSNMDTVVFFDEVNTTDAIGLIKEIMCDRRINGKPISQDIKFIAACNPYRKHKEDMIKRLESAGLGFFIKASETQQKLGNIPLRQLVYRVLDLPPSMRPLVYDFGKLNMDTESDYIKQIVHDHIHKHPQLSQSAAVSSHIANVLEYSQKYMRGREDECSIVSLRDIERTMIVFEYLYGMMDVFNPLMDEYAVQNTETEDEEDDEDQDTGYVSPGSITRALVLALSVCYHARLHDREDYEEGVVDHFIGPIDLPGGSEQFRDEIRWCQEVLLDNMQLGDNIARNAALRENIFMMAICVELRIPLFLVGKPGSSKSLAKSIINESMRGKDSRNDLLKRFKEVGIFSYQCSQLSTPESVIEVFKDAMKFQAKHFKSSYVAVVVLDEVGLAEDSPNLPLKALHPLLEDGTEGASSDRDFSDKIIDRNERVAFIGISNWALDPAKMNRGVMVTRADPSEDELVFSAKGICSNQKDDPIVGFLQQYFRPFARAYKKICQKQDREFFGLRDFYSLIKMLYYMCKKSKNKPTWKQLEHAIRRNFGGLESKEWSPFKEFERLISISHEPPDHSDIQEEVVYKFLNPDCSRLGLIKASLENEEKNGHGENRYVLFLTENYAALDILKNPKNYLSDKLRIADQQGLSLEPGKDVQPFILFGSSFPKDKEYTQVCRNINQIKICMETGRTVILLNLENLYESLYDVLNQYYIYHGDSRYVDLGLQTHRVRCRVHNDFKLILIAEKDTVYEKFPTPLINRLEKHLVLTSSILEDWQEETLKEFKKWISKFSKAQDSNSTFKESDAFVGFQKDTPATVIFQATALTCVDPDNLDARKEEVLHISKDLLLQTAAPEAIARLKHTPLADEREKIIKIYFEEQHHNSIEDFLIYNVCQKDSPSGLLMQVTTHSHLLSKEEQDQVENAVGIKVASFFLHEFDTELDFSNKIGPLFKINDSGSPQRRIVVVQCDSGHMIGDLIACARCRIYDLKARADKDQITHVLFIIHLSVLPNQVTGSSFVGFQGNPWISAHIDDLRPTTDNLVATQQAIGVPISDLFYGTYNPQATEQEDESMPSEYNRLQRGKTKRDSKVVTKMEKEANEDGSDLEERESSMSKGDDFSSVSTNESDSESDMREGDKREKVGTKAPKVRDKESEIDVQSEVQAEIEVVNIEGDELQYGDVPSEATGANMVYKSEKKPLSIPSRYVHHEVVLKSPLFKRLHDCIQAAASRFKEFKTKRSTERVQILVHLIPRELPPKPDDSQFHGTLIQHIYQVLKQKESLYESDKEWVIKEAMNAKTLQHGGTFCNVLTRKVDEVVIPIFSEIIARIDINYNLNLLNENFPQSQFWLSIFRNREIMQFNYNEFVTPGDQVPGVGGRKADVDFKCKLPFSWLIFDAVNSQWDNAKIYAGNDKAKLYRQLCDLVEPTPVGEVLKQVDECDCEEFYKNYLHDFVRIVHRCHQSNQDYEIQEYEIIVAALDALVHGDDFCSRDGNITLLLRVAAVHVVYNMNRSQVLWFGQLVTHNPGIMVHLRSNLIPDKEEMTLHLQAVERTLDDLVPPLDKDNPAASLTPWLKDVRMSQNAITSVISLPSQNSMRVNARLKWEAIRAMQLFLEYVLLKNPDVTVAYLIRLQLTLKAQQDFLCVMTLERVKNQLNIMFREVKKKKVLKHLKTFQEHCRNYFMEVVSTLCFGGDRAPEPDLIKMLMEIIYTEKKDAGVITQDLTPFTEGKKDKVPVIRSSLLQLLLEHNFEEVKEYLKEYFDRSESLVGEDQNLYLLCIQCFEDALYKEYASQEGEVKLQAIMDQLTYSHRVLRIYKERPEVNIEYLEAVAGVRFALMEITHLLHSNYADKQQLLIFDMHHVKELCTDHRINTVDFSASNTDVVGPAMYLVKLLVRQYGFPCLKQVCEAYPWIVPEGLRTANQDKVVDPFVIYSDHGYATLRKIISEGVYEKQTEKLDEATKDFNITEATVLLLTFYEKITLSYASGKKLMGGDLLESFNQFSLQIKSFSPAMRHTARLFLSNGQGGPLAQMTLRPGLPSECKTLGAIVAHAISVFSCRENLPILLPFINMMNNPAALANAYLPTMQEDTLQEVRRAMSGQFYACPRGHPYFVGECGRPVQELNCATCGARIGGINHALRTDNKAARMNDATQTGHVLGEAVSRTGIPAPERNLSSPAVCIMRALMHAAFIWCSCHQQDSVYDLAPLVKPFVNPDHLPEFFWMHLEKDFEHLSRVTGKSKDEAVIIVHLVLKDILTKQPPASGDITTVNCLKAKNAREHWEKEFNTHYIQPVLGDLDTKINEAMNSIAGDNKQEHDQLFYLVYERMKVSEGSIEPHLWSYRQRVSLDHLGQTLQEKNLREKYPILHEFLQVEPSLRATQYLPDIVKLQQCLYDSYHHRLDQTDAKRLTIGDFLDKLSSENSRNEYRKRIDSLSKAWSLVGQDLKTHGRLPVEDKHCLPEITNGVLLEYLIPTLSGAGTCTTSLVDFLTRTHNDFIDKCQKILSNRNQSGWLMHKVPITHIHHCHLLDYEHQIVSVVLSHCCYSLKVGEAHNIQYDHQALEKHILDKFIFRKPMIILSEIPHVAYRKDIYTKVTFEAVRKKVQPQSKLDPHIQQEIIAELRTPDRLRQCLDIVDIVIGFLSSGKVKARKPLGEYIDKVLKMKKRPFSQKAREHCNLEHILSLWKTLSVELARLTYLHGQEPFDSVHEKYLKDLSKTAVDDQKASLDKCLQKFDLVQLLGALYEFIETHVKYSPDNELLWSLKETLEPFEGLDFPLQFFYELPESITLDQTVAVWKHIVLYQELLKQE